MISYRLEPQGWPCSLAECPPGFFSFTLDGGTRGFGIKTEYGGVLNMEVFNESGESFWGGTSDVGDRANLTVQPVVVEPRQEDA